MSNEYNKRFYNQNSNDGIVNEECKAVTLRREKLNIQTDSISESVCITKMAESDLVEDKPPIETFGVALSGGGIRSATFNLGFLKALNDKGILKYADYLSTVSGGGYIGSFVQNRLKETKNYDTLFDEESLNHLKAHGDYLRPGKGVVKIFESFTFYFSTLMQTLLHSLWFILFFAFVLFFAVYIGEQLPNIPQSILTTLLSLFILVAIWYYLFHPLRYISRALWSAKYLLYALSTLAFLSLIALFTTLNTKTLFHNFGSIDSFIYLVFFAAAMVVVGFFANPNILSMHRYYRFRLQDTFLNDKKDQKLHSLIEDSKEGKYTFAPYPLINTTLNLQADKEISGMKSCDYFLLSPLYCGSKITGYTPSDKSEYSRMTLATALTISGAAVNPNMGYKSNRLLSFFMTLLNLRLGYWAMNPAIFKTSNNSESTLKHYYHKATRGLATWSAKKIQFALTLWPYYNIGELLGTMHSRRIRANLSDGGHIENLAAFELLRRKCKLIIASDAGADADYTFSDLQNLQIRARNELEISIEFPADQNPQNVIRPSLQTGQSQKHFCIANIYQLTKNEEKEWIGYFVFVKASVVAQKHKLSASMRINDDFYSYKNYHPAFPHESTVDQFFDEQQWNAYKTLGENIGHELLKEFSNDLSIDNLVEYFCKKQKET